MNNKGIPVVLWFIGLGEIKVTIVTPETMGHLLDQLNLNPH